MASLGSVAALQSVFQHVFLPPQLPPGEDETSCIPTLLPLILSSLQEFQAFQDAKTLGHVGRAIIAVENFQKLENKSDGVSEITLNDVFASLEHRDGPIPVHIEAQNSGVLVYFTSSEVIFEVFELSPSNEAVYSMSGRLQRYFPEDVVAVPHEIFNGKDFQTTVARTLATMSRESVAEMQPRTLKAGAYQVEARDTVYPFIVKNLFVAILQSSGGSQRHVPGFWKNTREEVMWSNGNKLPWRRSPAWLLLRVVLEKTLSPPDVNDQTHDCALYKRYMVFLMCKILERALDLQMSSDTLSVMNAKLAQRLVKLDIKQPESWMFTTSNVIERASQTLEQRWEEVIRADTRTLTMPLFNTIGIKQDLSIKIPGLDRYLRNIPNRSSASRSEFTPPTPDISHITGTTPPPVPKVSATSNPYQLYNLATFENWVTVHLELWLRSHKALPDTCASLQNIIIAYHSAASEAYQGQPEGMSVMFLTIIELWIACDKSAVENCPLIADYSPEVPVEPLRSLLLKSATHMKRLFETERYLEDRKRRAKSRRSILFHFGKSDDYGTRFVSSSSSHQLLLNQIQEQAARDREAKCQELRDCKQKYDSLISQANSMSCLYRQELDKWGDELTVHDGRCQKCLLRSQAKSLRIQAHEWPLPKDPALAQAVVFELRVPPYFGVWRDCTLYLLQKILGFTPTGLKPQYSCYLTAYTGLTRYFCRHSSDSIIELLSETKPDSKTHRLDRTVDVVQESEVCLETGPRWMLMNNLDGSFLGVLQASDHVSSVCTFNLPSLSQALRRFLKRAWGRPDGVDPNCVIASQHKCPQHFSVDEFKSLCSLTLGQHTQWPNLLVQLAMPAIDMNKIETLFFIWQLAEQCGPATNTWRRSTHQILEQDGFVDACLSNLQHCLTRVKESWESRIAVAILTFLGARLLSLSSDKQSASCLRFLLECRVVSCQWQRNLRHKAFSSQDDHTRLDLSKRAAEAALTCLLSFDVDNPHLSPLLGDTKAASVYLECLITLQETDFSDSPKDMVRRLLNLRARRLIRRCHYPVQSAITKNESLCLDMAIQANWKTFSRPAGSKWQPMKVCWLHTKVETGTNSELHLSVHFNIVTGELLLNGLPRGRLPIEYETHPTYKLLFGSTAFEAMPSSDPEMRFTASKLFRDYEVQFLIDKGSMDLVVRARKNGQWWELLPRRLFNEVLPSTFTRNYVYWYDSSQSRITLRSDDSPWEGDDSGWVMTHDYSPSGWTVQCGIDEFLVFPGTSTAGALDTIFSPLENLFGLDIIFNQKMEYLSVHMPRLNLDFTVTPGSDSIQSRQYKDMRIDSNQGIKTLIGLQNKLVLCNSNSASRMILIPRNIPKISARISTESSSHPEIQIGYSASVVEPYHLNNHLGQLVGNGSLKSRLFAAELHAMTSGCVPDPFTGYTGTEEALHILDSAAIRSLGLSHETDVQTLRRISYLSPRRTFYPSHLKQMQDVDWNSNMSPLVQSDIFATAATNIYQEAKKFEVFSQTPLAHSTFSVSNTELVTRSIHRSLLSHDRQSSVIPQSPGVKYVRVSNPEQHIPQRTAQAIKYGTAFRVGGGLLSQPGLVVSAEGLYSLLTTHTGTHGGRNLMPTLDFQYCARSLDAPSSVLPEKFCSSHHTLAKRKTTCSETQLISWLTTYAFAEEADLACLQVLQSFLSLTAINHVKIPMDATYALDEGYLYQAESIREAIQSAKVPFEISPEAGLPTRQHESKRSARGRRQLEYAKKVQAEVNDLEIIFNNQWPCQEPGLPTGNFVHINLAEAAPAVNGYFRTWFANLQFFNYLGRVCDILRNANTVEVDVTLRSLARTTFTARGGMRKLDILDLFRRLSPPPPGDNSIKPYPPLPVAAEQNTPNYQHLKALSTSLRAKTTSRQESMYIDQLDESISFLGNCARKPSAGVSIKTVDHASARHLHMTYQQHCSHLLQQLRGILSMGNRPKTLSQQPVTSWQIAALAHQWPRLSKRSFLTLMNRGHWPSVPAEWKTKVIALALSISDVQAAERLLNATGQDQIKERSSLSPRSWDPRIYPDSLLLEVEGNIRIRQVQEDIAATMREPPEAQNAVMQLNMGEGKSSVIVPIVAAALADGSRLVRVIVAKPQSRQMLHILVSKLGGLMNRQIYQMPMSRSVRLHQQQVQALTEHYKQCMRDGGVMLVQPEHLLSFQLMTIEMAIRQEKVLAQSLWAMGELLDSNSRDIVDESDENFSTKFELIYTMGDQRSIEHGPERWFIIQQVLGVVSRFARQTKVKLPKGIEMDEQNRSSFPVIRFLNADATHEVLSQAAAYICETGFRGFPIPRQGQAMRMRLLRYMLDSMPETDIQDSVESSKFWDEFKDSLLLLRGLFAGGILEFVFSYKRWRVNYGLDFVRQPSTRLAVPYRAKDSPSPRSEFSHPDVVISLTCLSYYYGGLSNEDQTVSLEHLLRSDQADGEFQDWVSTSDGLQSTFRYHNSINLRDKEQCAKSVFPCFRYAKGAVDYFLSHFVFPKEMKEFSHKLSSSGWDLGRVKDHPLTGFSGTNDSQHVLPVSVTQLQLSDQKHTNALVLGYLLQPENSVVSLAGEGLNGICKSRDLLKLVTRMVPEVRVVLDVGALILDMTNEEFAQQWLTATQGREDVQAVVFCSSNDNVCVLDRRGRIELLTTSPFAGQMDQCVAFLDEAHTRGIDLRLPSDYRAAVTLGANLTKDRLIQACMRMRKLGIGQSVAFSVPEEIETKIREMTGNLQERPISVPDVLTWAIRGTWVDLRRSMPLWFTQGQTFARQKVLWNRARVSNGKALIKGSLAPKFLEEESQNLEARYRYRSREQNQHTLDFASGSDGDVAILGKIAQRCNLYEGLETSSSGLQEEQERELAPEIEQERQLERPAAAEPAAHRLHPDVEYFVNTGRIEDLEESDAFMLAFDIFKATTASQHMDIDSFPRALIATREFEQTVKRPRMTGSCMDSYLRPVQWVLMGRGEDSGTSTMVIISPYEANKLMQKIQASKFVSLHLFAPRINQGFRPLDHLALYSIPANIKHPIPLHLRIELILFAGQPYFCSFQQYVEVCKYLCLAHKAESGDGSVGADGFIDPSSHGPARDPNSIVTESPVKFLKALMTSVRRAGEGIGKTHLGRLLDGALPGEDDFEEE